MLFGCLKRRHLFTIFINSFFGNVKPSNQNNNSSIEWMYFSNFSGLMTPFFFLVKCGRQWRYQISKNVHISTIESYWRNRSWTFKKTRISNRTNRTCSPSYQSKISKHEQFVCVFALLFLMFICLYHSFLFVSHLTNSLLVLLLVLVHYQTQWSLFMVKKELKVQKVQLSFYFVLN